MGAKNKIQSKTGLELTMWRKGLRAFDSAHTENSMTWDKTIDITPILNSIVEHIPNMIAVKEAKELRFVLFNKASEKFFGYESREIINKNDYDIFSQEQADAFFHSDQKALHEKKTFEVKEESIRTRHKGLRLVHTKRIPILDIEGNPLYLLFILDDITESMIDKEAVRLLESALQQSSEAVIITTADMYGEGPRILYVNSAYTTMTGYSVEEVTGKTLKMMQSESAVSLERIHEAIARGRIYYEESVMRRKDGTEFILEWNISPLKDEKEGVTHLLSIQRDVTARKKAEQELKGAYEKLRTMQRDLIQSEKMAALGRFSSGVAHEVKNPLGIILSGIEYLEKKIKDGDSDVTTALEKIKDATLRADTIVHGLLKFARPSELKMEITKPDVLIQEVLALLRYETSMESIQFHTEFTQEEFNISVDKGQLQQVFFNLIMNAVDAMPKGGQITIRTSRIASEPPYEEQCCVIEVIDEGEGISDENLQKIFEPFFTTKREKKGVGLGLFMSKMIVENHKGTLKVESLVGEGTKVKISLPITKSGGG